MYDFQKVGVWVQVRIWRCLKCEENKLHVGRFLYVKYIFITFIVMTSSVTRPDRTAFLNSLENFTRISLLGFF